MIDQMKLDRMAQVFLTDWQAQYQGPLRDYWGQRTVLQLQFAVRLAEHGQPEFEPLVVRAIDEIHTAFLRDGTISRETCRQAETILQPLATAAKRLILLCIGHAHIDMNWMWSYDETVAVTLATCRTMLDLMAEYPEFTYAQSQAAVYEIIARHDPALLAEIRRRVQEGRWEVTAATWVEADRNMPGAESMARQLLYTRQYLSELLAIPPDQLDLDYEPDTFGHHRDVPEILQAAGIRYYYHCRGGEGPVLYRWQAPSGRSVIAFREPLWYNWTMDGRCALAVPEFCQQQGLDVMLRVYGVGDHGGGPTRRDLERIQDMNSWPVFPTFRFGTYHEFFRAAEQAADRLPVIQGELNFVFDGCYTTQTRIKRGNRRSEAILFEAEAADALVGLTAAAAPAAADKDWRTAWTKVLFNQFHDILPGSGTADTREYAMGLYQQVYALANTRRLDALQQLASAVDTAKLATAEDIRLTRSEGAGVGFPTGSGNLAQTGRHAGLRRIFMAWNPLPEDRADICEVTVWDWGGDPAQMRFSDGEGHVLPHQVLTKGTSPYWGHLYQTVLVRLTVPAAGYATLVLDEAAHAGSAMADLSPRVEHPAEYILENDYLRVILSSRNGSIISLVDKETGVDMARPDLPLTAFRLIDEDPGRGMTAWVVGRYRKVNELADNIKFTGRQTGPLRQSLTWETALGNSSVLRVTAALQAGERQLRLDVHVRWQEIGSAAAGVPQLNLLVRPGYSCAGFRYDIPLGLIDRPALAHDVPASSYGLARNAAGRSLLLAADSKHGFRGTSEGLALTLIRSSCDPDPWPEIGEHSIRLILALAGDSDSQDRRIARQFNHPLVCQASRAHPGSLPLHASLLRLSGDAVRLEALKVSEDGRGLIVRLSSHADQPVAACLEFCRTPCTAVMADLHEQPLADSGQPQITGNQVAVCLPPHALQTLRVSFA